MTPEQWPNLPSMLFAQAARFGDAPFLWFYKDGTWQSRSWDSVAVEVRKLAQGLRVLGLQTGDRVLLVMENSPDWIIADFAIMTAGAISVPAYTTSTTEDYRYLLASSGAKAVIVSSGALARKVIPAVSQATGTGFIVTSEISPQGPVDCYQWDDVCARDALHENIDQLVSQIDIDETACLIHTSGTGGLPKGAMLTHRNILSNTRGVSDAIPALRDGAEIFLSFLPMNHAYEHMAGVMFPIAIGAQIYVSRGAEYLTSELAEVRPTVVTAVPRLFESLHNRLRNTIGRQGKIAQRLFQAALDLGGKRYLQQLGILGRITDRALDYLVRRKIRQRFGGRLLFFVSGGAPLNIEIGAFFEALGVPLLQGYGQTEASPVIAVNPGTKPRYDTVGFPLTDIEIRIAEDGEILVRGPGVMKGYWRDPEATAQVIREDWLHTGDVGVIDPDGHLRITDRKRDFIKNAGGEMIAPQRVEGFLTLQDSIAQAFVYGDRRPYLVALLVPSEDLLSKLKKEVVDLQQALNKDLAAAVEAANALLAPAERIRRFAIAAEPFSVANSMMTPTLKIRRAAILAQYRPVLDALYERATSS